MIKIRTQPHTEFAAKHLVNQLAKLGHPAKLIDNIDPHDKSLHIIYNSHELHVLPKRWVCMQTEVGQSHWFNPEYLAKIKKALAVWDYSEVNQACYDHPRKAIVTPGINPQPAREKDIDLLFYGWIWGSQRRSAALQSYKNIEVIQNVLGPEMWDILSRTKEVINIHYYDQSPLELYRINECLSHGCKVFLHDEGVYYTEARDNFEELKKAISIL